LTVALRAAPWQNVEPTPTPSSVVVVSDDPLARSGLVFLLSSQGMNADQSSEAVAADANAEVAIWDLGADAAAVGDRIDAMESAGQLVVALLPDATHAPSAFSAGARGLLMRNATGEALAAAVRAVAAGLVAVDPVFAPALVPLREHEPLAEELTARESQVLELLSGGLANKEIAAKMGISDHTVKFHVNAILTKLGAQSRTEAVVQAAKRGLVIL
jgi:two-component system, NarL family, nitrate/nitrite response regulator NarL